MMLFKLNSSNFLAYVRIETNHVLEHFYVPFKTTYIKEVNALSITRIITNVLFKKHVHERNYEACS